MRIKLQTEFIVFTMRIFSSLLALTLVSLYSFSQCVVEPWSLEKRVSKSTIVVEGKVVNQTSIWDNTHKMIYTINTLEVFRSFKGGFTSSHINVVTEGGRVGLDMLVASPSLELELGGMGIVMLKPNTRNISGYDHLYLPTASIQSWIQYNLVDYKAFDNQQVYNSIPFDLYEGIKSITGENITIIKDHNVEKDKKKIRALANPVISSFNVDTLSSGTETELTINGNNFGATRGSGKVGFKDANFGDGRYYYPPSGWSYTSWSNTQIKVNVPSRAGTGTVQVVNGAGESGQSSSSLVVKWAHSNLFYPLSSTDTPAFEIDHVSDNGIGGYTWQLAPNFVSNQNAVQSFKRSLEEWRCETQMNWIIGVNTTVDTVDGQDDVNVVRFTNFGDGKLGVCYSWYSGCWFSSNTNLNWFVRELDIQFDSTYNWYYGLSSPASNQYDFQSVTTHELGHGHQLGHVRDDSKVMHYSLSNGVRKANLVSSDIEAGQYIVARGIATSPCGPSPMSAVPSGSCNLTTADADFITDVDEACPEQDITVTDNTTGGVNSYAWNFGSNAVPASANSKGPHIVKYTSAGTKTITLIATNVIGADTTYKTVFVEIDSLDTPNSFIPNDSACFGFIDYTINTVPTADSYSWTLSSGGSFNGNTTGEMVQVEWTSEGVHTVAVIAANECGVSEPQKDTINVIPYVDAKFTEVIDGLEIDFTNISDNDVDYLWDFGDGNTSTEENPSHAYPDKGDYTVQLIVTNFCGSDNVIRDYTLNFSASVKELSNQTSIYPNPVKSGQVISLKGEIFSTYTITNIEGKELFNDNIMNNKLRLPVLPSAVYIVTLQNDDRQLHFRLNVIE
jgi:PKD repeat protein